MAAPPPVDKVPSPCTLPAHPFQGKQARQDPALLCIPGCALWIDFPFPIAPMALLGWEGRGGPHACTRLAGEGLSGLETLFEEG